MQPMQPHVPMKLIESLAPLHQRFVLGVFRRYWAFDRASWRVLAADNGISERAADHLLDRLRRAEVLLQEGEVFAFAQRPDAVAYTKP